MSVLLFRSRPCTSSSSSAPTSAPVFILSWLWNWRCQHIWNTFTTAHFGVKHHRRVGKRRNERQVRVGSTSVSYSMFKFCAENFSRIDFFLWFSLVSPCEKNNTSHWPKNYFPHQGNQFSRDVASQYQENGFRCFEVSCRLYCDVSKAYEKWIFRNSCFRHLKFDVTDFFQYEDDLATLNPKAVFLSTSSRITCVSIKRYVFKKLYLKFVWIGKPHGKEELANLG